MAPIFRNIAADAAGVCQAPEALNVGEVPVIEGEEVLASQAFSAAQPDGSEAVCRADSYHQAPLAAFESNHSYANYAPRLFSSSPVLVDAFNRAQRSSGNSGSTALITPFALAACTTHNPLVEGDGGDPVEPPTDKPDIIIGESDGGLGAGINTTFATGVCSLPVDLDVGSTGAILATCGSDGILQGADGIGIVERVSTSGSGVTALQLPTTLSNGGPVSLTSTYSDRNSPRRFTAFTPRNTEDQLKANPDLLLNSGIFSWTEDNVNNAVARTFERILVSTPARLTNGETVNNFRPNNPVSLLRVADRLFVLSSSKAVDKYNKVSTAPATIHRYSLNDTNGTLELAHAPGTEAKLHSNPQASAAVHVMLGSYYPTALGDVGDGRIAALIKGEEGGISSSTLHIFTTDLTSGALPGVASGEIPLAFKVSDSRNIAIRQIGGRPHAIIGSSDNSGYIAVVDLQKDFYAEPGGRVAYIKVLDGADLSPTGDVLIRSDGEFAFVTTSKGKIRSVNLGKLFGEVGPTVYTLHNGPITLNDRNPSILTDGAVFSARAKAYSKAPISQ